MESVLLKLLQAKDPHETRCNRENIILKQILISKARKMEEQVYSNLNKIAHQNFDFPTNNLQVSQHQQLIEIIGQNITKKFCQIDSFYNILLQKLKDENSESRKEIQKSRLETNKLVQKNKRNAEIVHKENISLLKKFEELCNSYMKKNSLYESELKNLNSAYSNLNAENQDLKKSYLLSQKLSNELKLENNNFKSRIFTYDRKINNLVLENEEIKDKIKQVAKQKEIENIKLNSEVQIVKQENKNLELRLNTIKTCKQMKSCCNIVSHKILVNQNEILKKLVKKIRNERDQLELKNYELEKRIEEIEKLIKTLEIC